jgi:ribosomal protein S18 acetylase RimI-like enzyme
MSGDNVPCRVCGAGVRLIVVHDVLIRKAVIADLPALGRLGALLLRTHYDFDPQRFIAPDDHADEGYAWFLGTQLRREDVAIFVAERDGEVLGYVYAGIEPHSWKELREEAGFIHDIVVDERGRRTGIASALMERAIEWLRERGMPRVVLGTAERNDVAQRLFAALGFRRTMIEMTREL